MPRLIDAEKLWKAITTRIEEYCDIADLIEIIETQPTVDAEPVKHGHWEKPQRHGVISYDEHAYAECSCCHKSQYLARGMNYCPHCGADMRGREGGKVL